MVEKRVVLVLEGNCMSSLSSEAVKVIKKL